MKLKATIENLRGQIIRDKKVITMSFSDVDFDNDNFIGDDGKEYNYDDILCFYLKPDDIKKLLTPKKEKEVKRKKDEE